MLGTPKVLLLHYYEFPIWLLMSKIKIDG